MNCNLLIGLSRSRNSITLFPGQGSQESKGNSHCRGKAMQFAQFDYSNLSFVLIYLHITSYFSPFAVETVLIITCQKQINGFSESKKEEKIYIAIEFKQVFG